MFTLILVAATTAQIKLSWETTNPKASEWTTITLAAVEKHLNKLNEAQDVQAFCPAYSKIDFQQRIHFWGELISTLAFYESGWHPNAQLTEAPLGIDSVTGKTVVSEGLLQLSYGDTRWAKWCAFDWEADKNDRGTRPTTILDPKANLECGIGILARQINKRKAIVLGDKRAYWSTLKEGHDNNRIERIKKVLLSRLQFCK